MATNITGHCGAAGARNGHITGIATRITGIETA
jgi:hypothetical protein